MAKASDVISQITMINNFKYINNIKHTNIVSEESNEVETDDFVFPLASPASQPLGEALASSGTLPLLWKGVKLDLFANPGLTLKLTIVRQDNTKFPCSASLNSPLSYVYRGREQEQGTEEHWELLDWNIQRRKDQGYDVRASKIGKPRKGGTLKDFAAVVFNDGVNWNVDLVYELQVWHFILAGDVSDAFSKKNGIATTYCGVRLARAWQDPKELGI